MSAPRSAAYASSRVAAVVRAAVPAPPESRLSANCSDTRGVTTEYASSMPCNSVVICSSVARLSPVNRSCTSASPVALNSRITVSPPNASWKMTLSSAICDSGLR